MESIYFIVQFTIFNGTFVIKRAIIAALDGTEKRYFYPISFPHTSLLNELSFCAKGKKLAN